MEDSVLDNNMSNGELLITPEIKTFLMETARWAKLLAIVGFVVMGLIVIFAIIMGAAFGSMSSELDGFGMIGGGFLVAVYIFLALIYLFPILYLYRFATKMKTALQQNDQSFLYSSFENLKSHYKFFGVLTLIMMAIWLGSLLLGLVMGGAALM